MKKKSLTFEDAVKKIPGLEKSFCSELLALKRIHRKMIICSRPGIVSGSIDLDSSLERKFPDACRWDYGIGVNLRGNPERIDWIEIHSANSDHNISEMFKKVEWLIGWINEYARVLLFFQSRRFVWIASGSISFQAGSPQRRRIAQKGLIFSGRKYLIDS